MLQWLQQQFRGRSAVRSVRLTLPVRGDRRLRMQRYEPAAAEHIASWLLDERDAFWAAPRSRLPIDAAEVADWADKADHAFVGFLDDDQRPCVYGEINNFAFSTGESWIGHLIVAPRVRGTGVGKAFCEGLIRVATEHLRRHTVSLVVFPDNLGAIACYRRVGFIEAGCERKTFPGHPGDHRLVRMVWTRRSAKRGNAQRRASITDAPS